MFAGHPILDEIRQGFKLKPTKTVDKSKPIIFAEGEDPETSIAPTKKTELKVTSETPETTSALYLSVKISSPQSPKPNSPPSLLIQSVIAPPPPPPPSIVRTLPSGLSKLGGKAPSDVDRGQLLKSIQGGIKLRKTVTNDKSGLIVDESLRQQSVHMVEPTPSTVSLLPQREERPKYLTYSKPEKDKNVLSAESSEDERYLTPDVEHASVYSTPEPILISPLAIQKEQEPRRRSDFVFDEKNLKVTKEDIEQEIPAGSAAAKIAKFIESVNASGGATISRNTFRPSPTRTIIQKELNNNINGNMVVKGKSVSKWAPVEIGGLKQPTRGNVPIERFERASSELPRGCDRERSSPCLDEPIIDRARTQSPARYDISGRTSPACHRISAEDTNCQVLPAPISVKTDFPPPLPKSRPPAKIEIQETPPTPKSPGTTTPYSYSKSATNAYRPSSPSRYGDTSRTQLSPVSSMSSASLPSPSSISPGNSSPDTPRRRINPSFDKAKEKFGGSAAPTLPPPRPFFLKETVKRSVSPQTNSLNDAKEDKNKNEVKRNEEIEAVKKAVKNAAQARQNRVINVPISAPWHTPRDTVGGYKNSEDAIGVGRAHKVVIGMEPFSSMHPEGLRRNYRFNIDLSNDSPLTIVNR